MIKNYLISGDTHGKVVERLSLITPNYKPEETALIILGDAGINFYLNKTDTKNKKTLTQQVIQFTALEVIMKSARKIFLLWKNYMTRILMELFIMNLNIPILDI